MSQEIIEGFRLSPQQRRVWLLRQSDRASMCAVRVNGKFNEEALRQALRQVVLQQEILRTTFKLLPGMTIPVQVISESPEVSFTRHDVAHISREDQDIKIKALLTAAAERRIDWEQSPLVHVDLIAQSSTTHVLIISLPVVCADAQSLACLVRQIATTYKAYSQAEEPSRFETMQYADFAEWQNELLEGEGGWTAKQYWKQQDLSGLDAQKLSFEKRNGTQKAFETATLPLEISPATTARIKAVANDCDVSPGSFALACWQILIARLTGSSSIAIGVAFDRRKFAELEEAIGLFSTFLPLRADLDAELSFEKILEQTSEWEREARQYQEYFSWEVDASEAAATPFFPFCFELRKSAESYRAGDLEFLVCESEACTDRFKLKFIFEDREDGFRSSLQFDASSFSSDDVRRLSDQLKTLIEDAGNRPKSALDDLEVMSEAERNRVLVDFNDTERPYPKGQTVHGLFEDQVAQRPDDLAVVCELERLSYRDLNARANQLARYLIKRGVGPDVPVGLCLTRSVDLIVGLLGILKAGGAYVPLDPGVPISRLSMILEDSGTRVLVTRSELTEGLRGQLASVVQLDSDARTIANESSDNFSTAVSDQNLVYLIFTSGSTGRPKGVAVEHRHLTNYVNAIWETLDLPAGSSFATVSTIAADLGNTALFTALCKGGVLHLITEERATDPDEFSEYFRRNQIDCLKIVPTHLSALLSGADPAGTLPLHRLVLGGEACPWSLVEKVKSLSPDCLVLNHYGPTEATVGSVVNCLRGELEQRSDTVPIGRPIANAQVYVLDRRKRPAPIGAPGELHISGSGLARGYINSALVTSEKFIPSPFNHGERLYRTGDLARYLPDGQIEFLGRSDDQVKVHGYRIEPGEIEIALRTYAGVSDCVVVAREDPSGDKRLVAYVITPNHKVSAGELRAFIKDRLPDYMMPSAFVFIDRLPLTPNGKIDRSALPAPDHSQVDGDRSFVSPRNQVEETLARIWSQVLGVQRIGVLDNFFDLGGDSILSIQIIARAHQAGLSLSPRQLFQHQTVSELAEVAKIDAPIGEQTTVTGQVPLLPVQLRFFELGALPDLHHYNQAMLLEVHGPADPLLFAKATSELLLQHDCLRLRFKLNQENQWQGTIVPPDDFVPFEVVDLSSVAEAAQSAALAEHAARLHASLNIQDGPLMRVALFDCGSHQNLLIVVHHLAVDGVSWRILLEDLQALYEQFSRGEKCALPPKTTSFKTWAERLTEYARSDALRDELSHWMSFDGKSPAQLPLDHAIGANTVASAQTVSVSLNADETRALLQEVPVVYRTQVNEVLLTAFVRALAPWTGSHSILVDLEGHGREEILEGVNLSRTVGWFTTIFPVMLESNDSQTPVETLRSVKDQLRNIPNRGIGYGLLRYANGDYAVAEKLRALPQAEVRFNYLGQVDRTLLDRSFFGVASQPSGPAQSPNAERMYLLNVIGRVTSGELRLEWTFSENRHHLETVSRFAQSYLKELRALISQCRTAGTASYVPSDFRHATLSQEELNKVLTKLRG